MADANCEGHFGSLLRVLRQEPWNVFLEELQIDIVNFETLALSRSAPDDVLWRAVQDAGAVLITSNRNHDGPTSLEAAIRNLGTPQSLPVLTIASVEKFEREPEYVARCAVAMLERLLDIDGLRGAGRIYIP